MISSAQLSLFDTSAAVGSFYKPGDWVKIKKMPVIAKHVKCRHVYKLHSVLPDGRLKFWNPFTTQWDFLYPREVTLALTPADHVDSVSRKAQIADTEYAASPANDDDSPTPAEVVVGESIAPNDSPTPAEVVVGESIAPNDSPTPAEVAVGESFVSDDSPTPAEVAVGESFVRHSETDIISPVQAVTESDYPHSEFDSPTPVEIAVGESIIRHSDDSLAFNPISTYRPRGTARGGQYYRLSYKERGKVRQVHICGGNTDSPIAQAKVREVRSLLAGGMSPAEVVAILKSGATEAVNI